MPMHLPQKQVRETNRPFHRAQRSLFASSRFPTVSLLALLLVPLLLSGCSQSVSKSIQVSASPVPFNAFEVSPAPTQALSQQESDSQQDCLRVPMPKDCGALDPIRNASRTMSGLFSLVYEPLVQIDDTGAPSLYLAESYEKREDGVLAVKLRSVYFSDGSRLTAKQVVDTLDHIRESDASPWAWVLDTITDWEAEDDTTVLLQSSQGYQILYALTFPVLYSTGGSQFVGTGPYVISDFQDGESMTLQARQDWWRSPASIQTIQAIACDGEEEQLSLYSQYALDLCMVRRLHVEEYKTGTDVSVMECMTGQYEYLAFNYQRESFQSQQVRYAVWKAIDAGEILRQVYQSHAALSDVPIASDNWLYSEGSDEGGDPDSARKELASLGYIDRDNDGLFDQMNMESGQCEPISWTLLTNSDAGEGVRRETAVKIAEQLAAAGIQINIVTQTMEEVKKTLEAGEFDLFLGGCETNVSGDLTPFLSENGNANVGGYQSAVMDALLATAASASDAEAYHTAVEQIEQQIRTEIPFVGLFFRTSTWLSRDALRDVPGLRESIPFSNISVWRLVR